MALVRLQRQMIWVAAAASRYESDWMAWHRFLWMNAITGDDLWRARSGLSSLGSLPITRDFPSRYVDLIQTDPLTREFAAHFQSRSLRSCFGPKTGNAFRQIRHIRFCSACLAECFHSPIFQLACVNRCPLHGCKLLTACEHCGDPVGQPRFDYRYFQDPLACPKCHRPFAERERGAQAALSGFEVGEVTFRDLEPWLQRLRTVQFHHVTELAGEPVVPRDYPALCASLVQLAGRPQKSDGWLDQSEPCNTLERRDLKQLTAAEKFAREKYSHPLNKDIGHACATAKSIDRFLSRRIRAICGHRRTAHLPWENAHRPYVAVQPVLLMAPRDCPCCAVLDQWRAYAGKLLTLRNLSRSLAKPVYESRLGDFRVAFSLEPRACGNALFSSFTWFAVTLNRVVQCLARRETDFWYRDDEDFISRRREQSNVLPLEGHRFDIACHGYVFSVRHEQISLKYSLAQAISSLEAAHALYKDGVRWFNQDREGHRRTRLDYEHWYLAMSTHLQLQRASAEWSHMPSHLPSSSFVGSSNVSP